MSILAYLGSTTPIYRVASCFLDFRVFWAYPILIIYTELRSRGFWEYIASIVLAWLAWLTDLTCTLYTRTVYSLIQNLALFSKTCRTSRQASHFCFSSIPWNTTRISPLGRRLVITILPFLLVVLLISLTSSRLVRCF